MTTKMWCTIPVMQQLKKTFHCGLKVLLMTALFVVSLPNENRGDVIAYWPFNEGIELLDASGNGNTLTNSGVVFENGTAVFNGQASMRTLETLALNGIRTLTVECFVKVANTNDLGLILEHSANFNSANGSFVMAMNELFSGSVNGSYMNYPVGLSRYNIQTSTLYTLKFRIKPFKFYSRFLS